MSSHVGFVSAWYYVDDYTKFLQTAEQGDLLELDRDGLYQHWAVYIGSGKVVHRNNPQNTGILSLSSKGKFGIGGIAMEKLRDIWAKSKMRINNSADKGSLPFSVEEIVKRCLSAINDSVVRKMLNEYNLLTDNCEHFCKWARNGRGESKQVQTAVTGAAIGFGALAAIAGITTFAVMSQKNKRKSLA